MKLYMDYLNDGMVSEGLMPTSCHDHKCAQQLLQTITALFVTTLHEAQHTKTKAMIMSALCKGRFHSLMEMRNIKYDVQPSSDAHESQRFDEQMQRSTELMCEHKNNFQDMFAKSHKFHSDEEIPLAPTCTGDEALQILFQRPVYVNSSVFTRSQ